MRKLLRKVIMIRSKIKTKYNKNRTHKNWPIYKKKRNRKTFVLIFYGKPNNNISTT